MGLQLHDVLVEELSLGDGQWRYRWRLYGFSWGDRELKAAGSFWRVRVGDGGGARLELVTEAGEIWIGSGANARSTASIEEVARFPRRFLAQDSQG